MVHFYTRGKGLVLTYCSSINSKLVTCVICRLSWFPRISVIRSGYRTCTMHIAHSFSTCKLSFKIQCETKTLQLLKCYCRQLEHRILIAGNATFKYKSSNSLKLWSNVIRTSRSRPVHKENSKLLNQPPNQNQTSFWPVLDWTSLTSSANVPKKQPR